MGADPRAVGDARRCSPGLDTRLRLGTLVSPVTFRPPGITAKTVATLDVLTGGRAFCGIGAGWWEREHLGVRAAVPAGPRAARPARGRHRDACGRCGRPGTKAYAGERVDLPETTCYPRPVGRRAGHRRAAPATRLLRVAAGLGDGCNLPAPTRPASSAGSRCCAGTAPSWAATRPRSRSPCWTCRSSAATATTSPAGSNGCAAAAGRGATRRQHHAGTAADHADRYGELAEPEVGTVFVALPDLVDADDLRRLEPVLSRLR